MKSRTYVFAVIFLIFGCLAFGNDDHDHGDVKEKGKSSEKLKESGHSHEKEEGKSEQGDHEEHSGEEENPQVGPNKGIIAASPENGIKLSPEAEKNFSIRKMPIGTSGTLELQKKFIVTAGTEKNLFRYRSGFYKRIDFEVVRKSGDFITIKSRDLKQNDEIVVEGMGFLRLAEIAAFGGAPEGHSH